MIVLPPTNTEGKRANSSLIMNHCTGFSGFLLLSSTARTVAELQTGPRAPLPGPALPPRARACSGKDEHCSRLYSTRQAPAHHPPGHAGLGKSERGGPSTSLNVTVTRAWKPRVPPLPPLGERSWEGISFRGSAGRSPPRCRRLVAARAGAGPRRLPSKPSHRTHAVPPAAAAARSNEQPTRPSSRQRLTHQAAGSGSGKPRPEAEPLSLCPSRPRPAVSWVSPLLPPGEIQETQRGEPAGIFCKDLGGCSL